MSVSHVSNFLGFFKSKTEIKLDCRLWDRELYIRNRNESQWQPEPLLNTFFDIRRSSSKKH